MSLLQGLSLARFGGLSFPSATALSQFKQMRLLGQFSRGMSRPEALFVGVLAIGVGVVVTAAFFEQSESRAVTAAAPEHVELAAQLAVEATQQDKADARFALALDSAKAVKSLSRDPDSLQWELIGVDDEATVACLMYRSRNRLGGHRNEFAIFVNREVMTSGVDWKKHCTNVPLHDELEVAARLHSGEH